VAVDFTGARDDGVAMASAGPYANHSRQITMPVPHHSVFLQAGCPSCHPTNSVKALKAIRVQNCLKSLRMYYTKIIGMCMLLLSDMEGL